MLRIRRKSTVVLALGVSLLLAAALEAVEIDPKEATLIQVTFPVDDNAQADGPHEEIVFVIYRSGIGKSFHKLWNDRGASALGSIRSQYNFWLEPSRMESLVSTAKSYAPSKEVPPRNQQMIIEGSALPNKVTTSWYSPPPGLSALTLIHLMDVRMRADLLQHFKAVQQER